MRLQHGFTLLELMVSMAIFAMLAVAGWQVFDGVNRARERAQYHADELAVLQYAYLQLQQDMGQIIAYQAADAQHSSINDANSNNNSQANPIDAEPFMNLDSEHVSFVRFADPDPRYQSSTSVQRIEYIFTDQRLIRRQYTSIQGGLNSLSLDSVLLEGVIAGRWQAYLPEMSNKFPNTDSRNNNNTNRESGQVNNMATDRSEAILLPKGIAVNFTYQDIPITWQWALAPQGLPHNNNSKNANSGDNNNLNNSSNNDGNNIADNTLKNSNLESSIENALTNQ